MNESDEEPVTKQESALLKRKSENRLSSPRQIIDDDAKDDLDGKYEDHIWIAQNDSMPWCSFRYCLVGCNALFYELVLTLMGHLFRGKLTTAVCKCPLFFFISVSGNLKLVWSWLYKVLQFPDWKNDFFHLFCCISQITLEVYFEYPLFETQYHFQSKYFSACYSLLQISKFSKTY